MKAEAYPSPSFPDYWNVWLPDDEEKRTGTKLAELFKTVDEACAYARGYNDGARLVDTTS